MKSTDPSVYNLASRRAVHLGVSLVVLPMILLHSLESREAAFVSGEFRVGGTIARFDDTEQVTTVFELWSPRRLRAKRIFNGDLSRMNTGFETNEPNIAFQLGE